MKHTKNFENFSINEIEFYHKLASFFNEIKLKKDYVEQVDYAGYSFAGIYRKEYSYIIKISDGILMKSYDVDKYYPYIYEYLKSKLPMSDTYKDHIDIKKMKDIEYNVFFSKEEYDMFKTSNKYNL